MSDTEEVVQKQDEEPMETDAVVDEQEEKKEEKTTPASSPAKKSPTKSPTKSPAKSPKKTAEAKESPAVSAKSSPAKSPKKAKKEESEEEEEEDDEEDEVEQKKGVLDMPLVIEGKRKRESTSFLKIEENVAHKHKAPATAGSGVALEEIPFVLHQLDSEKKVQDLRPLYRICYGSMGKVSVLRKELRKFNGYSFAKDSAEYKRKHDSISKFAKAELSHARRILGLNPVKSKEEEVQIILDFLMKPHDEGKSVPKKAAAKRKSSTGGAKTPAKRSKKESTSKSKETIDTESGENSEETESGDEEKKTPKKTPKKTHKKAAEKKKEAKTPSKTPSKKAAKKAESEDEEEKGEDSHSGTISSSDDSQKKDEKPEVSPTDKELKAKIAELLKTFDLTSVSMKQMVLAVCNAFPDHPEITERAPTIKAFIKEEIRNVE